MCSGRRRIAGAYFRHNWWLRRLLHAQCLWIAWFRRDSMSSSSVIWYWSEGRRWFCVAENVPTGLAYLILTVSWHQPSKRTVHQRIKLTYLHGVYGWMPKVWHWRWYLLPLTLLLPLTTFTEWRSCCFKLPPYDFVNTARQFWWYLKVLVCINIGVGVRQFTAVQLSAWFVHCTDSTLQIEYEMHLRARAYVSINLK